MLTDRVFVGPKTPGYGFTDEHHGRPAHNIGIIQVPTAQQRDAHSAQVAWGDDANVNFRLIRHRHDRLSFHGDGLVRAAAVQRQAVNQGGGQAACRGGQRVQQLATKPGLRGGRGEHSSRGGERRREYVHGSGTVPRAAWMSRKAAPERETISGSARMWRSTMARLAPSDVRMAISFFRARVLASTRLATLAHAMRSTKATAPNKTSSAGRTSPTSCSRKGRSVAPQPLLSSGYCCSRRAEIALRSSLACATLTSGLRRPITM